MKYFKKSLIPLIIVLAVFFYPLTVNAATISGGSIYPSKDGTSGRLVINSVSSTIIGSQWSVTINYTINMVNSWLYTGGDEYYRYFTPEINGVTGPRTMIKENTESWYSGTSHSFLYNLRIPVDPDNNVVSARFKVTDANGNMSDVATFDTGAGNTVTLQAVQKATGLSLSPSSVTLYTGETETITPTVTPTDTYNKSVGYTSSDTSVAIISSSGVVTAKKAGSATITVKTKDGSNISKTAAVTVRQYVTSISVNDTSPTIYAGSTFQLTATPAPNDATDKSLSYSSSNTAAATVNASGKITALKAGTATITVTATDRSTVKKTVTVEVLQKAESITINNPVSELYVGLSHQLSSTVLPSDTTDKNLTYSSSNTAVATVNSGGLITAVKTGTATVTVKTADGSNITKTMSLTIKQYVTSISVNDTSPSIYTGSTFQLITTVSPSDASDKSLSYTSNNTAIATVNASGLITAVKAGTAVVTVTATDRSTIKATVTVTVLQRATALSINNPISTLYTGTSHQLNCTVSPNDTTNKSLNYSSSNTAVAAVGSGGLITAVKAGTATITVKTADGSNIIKTMSLIVKQYVTSISVNDTSQTLYTGNTFQLSATTAPSDASDKSLSFTSNNTAVATVNASGLITAVKAGTVEITVTATDRSTIKSTATVTVLQKATSLTINSPPSILYTAATSQLSCTVSPSDTSDKSLTYTSSDQAVASISPSGLITAKKAGTSTITVKTKDGSNLTKSFLLTVKQYVTSLAVSPAESVIYAGSSLQLNISALPEDATDASLICSSSDEEIATVSNTGKITAKKAGNAKITVTATDRSTIKTMITVTVLQRATSLTIDNPADHLYTSETHQLSYTVLPADTTDKSVTYLSSDPAVATISDTGLITAVKAGMSTITVKTKDGSDIEKSFELTVKQYVTNIITGDIPPFLYTGVKFQITASALPKDATDKSFSYSSDNDAIAEVNDRGLIQAKKAGNVNITVKAMDGSDVTKTFSITVKQKAQSITIINPASEIYIGETYQLSTNILPEYTSDKSVSFISCDKSVAIISDSGLITALKKGVVEIKAVTKDSSDLYDSFELTVKQHAESLTLSQSELTLYAGENDSINTTLTPEDADNKQCSFTSSDDTIAEVTNDGKVKAVKTGTAVIKVQSLDNANLNAECVVTVKQYAEKITLDKQDIELPAGSVYEISADVLPEDTTDKALSYQSSDDKVAAIDNNGIITAKSPGTAKITITAADRGSVKAVISVKVIRLISSIEMPSEEIELYTGHSLKLSYTIYPEDVTNAEVTFESDEPDIALVDKKGVVTANKPGSAMITIRAADGSKVSKIVSVIVRQSVTSLTVADKNIKQNVGDIYELSPEILPDNAYNKSLSYSSSDQQVASVDDKGQLTANKVGKVEITIRSTDGSNKKATVKLTVIQPVTGISLQYDNYSLIVGDTLMLKAEITPSDAADKDIIWTSSDETIAKVDQKGKVTALKEGSAVIKAASKENSNISDECFITVKEKELGIIPPEKDADPPEKAQPPKTAAPIQKEDDPQPSGNEKKNDQPETEPVIPDKSEDEDRFVYSYTWYEYIFIALGTLSLTCCLIYFLIILAKKKKKQESDETEMEKNEQE